MANTGLRLVHDSRGPCRPNARLDYDYFLSVVATSLGPCFWTSRSTPEALLGTALVLAGAYLASRGDRAQPMDRTRARG